MRQVAHRPGIARALAGALLAAAGTARAAAAEPPPTLDDCARIGAPTDRLACYDRLAGRAPPQAAEAASAAARADAATAPAPTTLLAPAEPQRPDPLAAAASGSLVSRFWELDREDKRGVFNFTGYRPNYILPVHLTSRINRAPQSPTQPPIALPDYRQVEAKFQLSLRTKVAQDLLLPGADLWLAFTQQVLWQIWNTKDSKPFRNSDYEPEVIYVIPTGRGLRTLPGGWQWRYTQLGLAHQSNGQSDPLSRSWNRIYLGAGFERGDWSVVGRVARRIAEDRASDNNPDLVPLRGRAELQVSWAGGLATSSLLWRNTLEQAHFGALQFEWTYPVRRNQPNGLRWYLQVFSGYGETLTDYNFRQTSVGAGVTFLQF